MGRRGNKQKQTKMEEQLPDLKITDEDKKNIGIEVKSELKGNKGTFLEVFYYNEQCRKGARRKATEVIECCYKEKYKEQLGTASSDNTEPIKIPKKVRGEMKQLKESLVEEIVNSWNSSYNEAHADVVEPMTKDQIIQEAKNKDISVDEGNFDEVYKRYRPSVGLLGNACQSRSCPWFLIPKEQYNEHARTERRSDNFPHALHKVTSENCTDDVTTISNKIVSWEGRKSDVSTTHERLEKIDLSQLKNAYMK